jgi:hypothetical protein
MNGFDYCDAYGIYVEFVPYLFIFSPFKTCIPMFEVVWHIGPQVVNYLSVIFTMLESMK